MIDPNQHTIVGRAHQRQQEGLNFIQTPKKSCPPTGTVPIAKEPKAKITADVDADHAHDQVTRRSVTDILIFVNNTKRQETVETSTYGSELVASRIAAELVMEYCYALRSLGVEIDEPTLMHGDNNAVVLNTTLPSSQLKEKHKGISYHQVREAIASGILEFRHIPSW